MDIKLRPPYRSRSKTLGSAVEEFGESKFLGGSRNGREALELASDDIDLYVLDVNMPEMTGLMAASELRRRFDTPIIFLTAYSSESDKVMGFSVGADDYIVKPFSNAELLMRVRAILRRSVSAIRSSSEKKRKNVSANGADTFLFL